MALAGWGVVLWMAACRQEKPYEPPVTPVNVELVEKSRGEGGLRYSGNIEPLTRVDLAFKVGGYVREIRRQEGEPVKRGEVLARLRESDYQVKLEQARSQLGQADAAAAQARSQLREAQAAQVKAQADFRRADRLFAVQSLTRPDYDAAKAQLDAAEARLASAQSVPQQAEARLEGARAALREAEIALEDTALKSPLDGVVLKRLVEVGSLVGPGSGAYVVADISSVKVIFGAPDVLLPELRVGGRLAITTESIARAEFPGRISRIAPAADTRSRVFEIEVTVPNPQGRLKPGMIASLQVPGRALPQPLPIVPLTAIVRSKDRPAGYAVMLVEDQGGRLTARSRNVSLGETFGNRIAITEGLRGGERVIVSGASMIRDGETVAVLPGGAP